MAAQVRLLGNEHDDDDDSTHSSGSLVSRSAPTVPSSQLQTAVATTTAAAAAGMGNSVSSDVGSLRKPAQHRRHLSYSSVLTSYKASQPPFIPQRPPMMVEGGDGDEVLPGSKSATLSFKKTYDPELFSFLETDAKTMAAQMALADMELFLKIQRDELASLAWTRADKMEKAPNVVAFTQHFNNITLWTSNEILQSAVIKRRAEKISHFIQIAKCCLDVNNFHGLKSILAGLQSTPVHRLAKTWAVVPKKDRQSLEKLSEKMSSENNSERYRKLLQQCRPPLVPFLGLHLSDLTFVSEAKAGLEEQLDAIEMMQVSPYDFKVNPPVKEFLCSHKFIAELQHVYEEQNYRVSLQLEPKETASTASTASTSSTPASPALVPLSRTPQPPQTGSGGDEMTELNDLPDSPTSSTSSSATPVSNDKLMSFLSPGSRRKSAPMFSKLTLTRTSSLPGQADSDGKQQQLPQLQLQQSSSSDLVSGSPLDEVSSASKADVLQPEIVHVPRRHTMSDILQPEILPSSENAAATASRRPQQQGGGGNSGSLLRKSVVSLIDDTMMEDMTTLATAVAAPTSPDHDSDNEDAGGGFSDEGEDASALTGPSSQLRPNEHTWIQGKLVKKEILANNKRAKSRSWKPLWAVFQPPYLLFFDSAAAGSAGSASAKAKAIVVVNEKSHVHVASDYKKRKAVLRLLPTEGSEILLAAPDDTWLRDWVSQLERAIAERRDRDLLE